MARQAPTFSTVRSEGGLLPPDLLQRIVEADADLKGFERADYGLRQDEPVREAISRAWSRVKAFWAAFQAATEDLPVDQSGVTETREQWMLPLLRTLGYRPEFHAAAEEVQGRRYLLSHRDGPVAIHVVSFREKLDEATRASDGRRMNAHALLQEYLNRSEGRLYGIVSNGKILRLLRDNFSLTRLAYLEFDLEAMLEGGVYADFVLLWLALHRTRLPASETDASSCWLETWRAQAETQGTRAMGELRKGVEQALMELGTGLLAHPANEALRARLKSGKLTTEQFYAQLLRLLYRLLFLFVTEERDLLFSPADENDSEQVTQRTRLRDRYLAHYSVSRLREIVRRYADDDRHDDLWRGLALVFDVLAGRREGLGLPSLGGGLFTEEACQDIDAGALISNRALAQAIAYLSTVRITDRSRRGGRMQWRRVNYRDIDVEELGGVYEGLLERQPSVVAEADNPHFELVGSGERKASGSYYTPSSLVQELIKSALDPVIADRLEGKQTTDERVAALLSITVCDTAAGSGHFLLAAARRIADQLARVRAGDREPSPPELRHALRDTIRSCIYGVDLNPLAVDLCRLALWLEGHEAGRPVTFLDHRIKCGNSLIGATPDLVREGIPDGAFDPVTGDDKKLASAVKRRNRPQRAGAGGQRDMFVDDGADWTSLQTGLARESAEIGALPQDAVTDLESIRARHDEHRRGVERARATLDAWTAAFFWPLPADGAVDPLLSGALNIPAGELPTLSDRQEALVKRLRDEHRFFHWHLEFPEVFDRGGFDCVLGNPPWERIKLQELEFFADRDKEIAGAPNAAARKKLIATLPRTNPSLAEAFAAAQRHSEGQSLFVRASGRFPLTAVGDVNLYPLFAEHGNSIVHSNGEVGLVVPTGIVTDDSTKNFFSAMVLKGRLRGVSDFENEEFIFPSVTNRVRFCLLHLGPDRESGADFVFFCRRTDHLRQTERHFKLGPGDLDLLNPNTRTCPIFRTSMDAELTLSIYRRVPPLSDEVKHTNPWSIAFLRMFDMSGDSGLFDDKPGPGLVPLYEAKLFHQFDHRATTYEGATQAQINSNRLPAIPHPQKSDPWKETWPANWVPRAEVESRLQNRWHRGWLLVYRDIARATDERTLIAAVVSRVGVGHTAPVILPDYPSIPRIVSFIGNLASLVLDFVTRTKVGGSHLTYGYLRQFPILPPSAYAKADLEFIVPRVLELTFNAWDLKPFAEDLGYDGPPFIWDEDRRAILRAELDAYYASLYGLTHDELRYILDPSDVHGPDFPGETFRVLKNNETRRYGEFRTQRLVLEAWDRLGLAPRNRDGRYDPNAKPVEDTTPVLTVVPVPSPTTPVTDPVPADFAAVDDEQSFAQISPLLEFAVENRFPYPIARAFYQLKETSEPAAEAAQLANIVGVTLEYLALVSVASYLATDSRDDTLNASLSDLLSGPISHGKWAGMTRETLAGLSKAAQSACFDELSAQYLPEAGDTSKTDLQELTGRLVSLRNDVLKRTAGELPSAALVRELKRALLRALQGLGFLAEYPLVAAHATTVADGVKIHQCRLLTGFHDSFAQTTVQCDLDLERERLALLKPKTGEVLYLDPLYTLRQCKTAGCDRIHLFALDRIGSKEIEYVAAGGHRFKDRPAAASFHTELRFPGTTARRVQAQHLYLGTESLVAQGALPRGYKIAGKYELICRIGRGMADVYEARRLSDGASVALKLFPPQLLANHTLVNRFRSEAAQARGLDHPNVARVLDYGQGLFEMYLVMELAEGWPTDNGLRALDVGQLGHPLPLNQALDIARQACEALECVHEHDIVHRDVKPANLLLFADGQVKLADFGIARARDQIAMTMTGIPMGTPEYMSPEQTEGSHELTPASDVYSLGVVLYELLTDQNPFKRAAPLATMAAQSTHKPPAPSTVLPSIPPALDGVIMRCLQKEPEKRYRSARELYQALARADS